MLISRVSSTLLFAGTAARPLQIIRVTVTGDAVTARSDADNADVISVRIDGPGVRTPEPALLARPASGDEAVAEVGVAIDAPVSRGSSRQVTVTATSASGSIQAPAEISVAEPGWTMWMVSHFHYDPVWWNTQGQFLQTRLLLPDDSGELPEVRTAFELVKLHLDAARKDADYKFVLAEIDYLKPHFDAHPEDRADLLAFIRAGRIELVGGSYNEPNTNLTCAESTIRNAAYGMAFQRDVLGGRPTTAWMLDAFGFDPSYPGLMASAGLAESSWARGPFHQWGPGRSEGGNEMMQFSSEFEWISPDGAGLLTSYMANHYSAGWITQHAKSLAAAERDAYRQFEELAPVAATRNVLLPVGGDHVIPSRWATAIHRDWNSRYLWPRFVTAVPSEFFAAVRAEIAERDIWISPQTRDMNPVYTGKDVTYIDTKQGQRAAEVAVQDGERLCTLAWLAGACYPAASLDKAWRQLVFGAHHDAITGTEGDQVYLDLLGGWREAWERGDQARIAAAGYLAGLADTAAAGAAAAGGAAPAGAIAVVVFNTLSGARSAITTIELELAEPGTDWLTLLDPAGAVVPVLAEGIGRHQDGSLAAVTLTFRAAQVPGLGYLTYLAVPAKRPAGGDATAGWQQLEGAIIENDSFRIEADPASGGTLASVFARRLGRELLSGPGNELLLQPEYPSHPRWAEGPWLLCPQGGGTGSAAGPATIRAERCATGSRLVATVRLGDLSVTQETLLWDGADIVEFRTHVDGSIGQDTLLRVLFPASVPGGLPVYQAAVSAVGRPPGQVDTDVAVHHYTLDNPAHEWFAAGSTARLRDTGTGQEHALGVAEVVVPDAAKDSARPLLAALARAGVTATCSRPDGPRYGWAELDSNLPDFRISLGDQLQNSFTAAVLAAAGQEAADTLARQLAGAGTARLWIPALRSRDQAFAAGADLRGTLDLPVLVVAANDLAAAAAKLTADLADAVIEAPAAPAANDEVAGGPATALAGYSVALLNQGTPSSVVSSKTELSIALMRSCSTWPCGVWIDGPARTVPDGTSFAWQHWSHTFEYALAAGPGDWREAGFAAAGQDYNHRMLAVQADLHDGRLPAAASLAGLESSGSAAVSALKPRGNPLAPGPQPLPAAGVTVRLREQTGLAGDDARITLFTGLAAASQTGVLEEGQGEPVPVSDGAAVATLRPAGLTTLAITPQASWPRDAVTPPAHRGAPAAAQAMPEPAQPVYARYWLHGKGPAPAGNLPVAVHLSPGRLCLGDGDTGQLTLTVAAGPAPASGEVSLDVPAGLSVAPAGPLCYDLAGLGHQEWQLTVRAAGLAPGRRFIAAQISDAAGQLIEDAAVVAIGEQDSDDDQLRGAEIEVGLARSLLELRPGESGLIEARIANRTCSVLRGEAQLISPHGSWQQVRPWTTGFSVAPGSAVVLPFEVTAARTARSGQQWWAIVKIMYFGRLAYTEAVQVMIG